MKTLEKSSLAEITKRMDDLIVQREAAQNEVIALEKEAETLLVSDPDRWAELIQASDNARKNIERLGRAIASIEGIIADRKAADAAAGKAANIERMKKVAAAKVEEIDKALKKFVLAFNALHDITSTDFPDLNGPQVIDQILEDHQGTKNGFMASNCRSIQQEYVDRIIDLKLTNANSQIRQYAK